jgi:hypothetical protein
VTWVIVAVIAVVVFAAWVIARRRSTAVQGRSEAPAAVEAPRAEPPKVGATTEPADAAVAQRVAEEEVAGEEAVLAEATAATVEPASLVVEAEAAVEEAAVAAPAKEAPAVSLRSLVEGQLEESARLLSELREVVSGAEGDSALDAGSVEIMEEGLEEIRALAERKQWGPARDKGKALHAQLTLLLQSARREKSP